MTGAALSAARRIVRAWDLTDVEVGLLLRIELNDVERFYAQNDYVLAPALRERVAVLIAIWVNLASLFGRGPIADGWIRRQNRDFNDRPPLERMMNGEIEDLQAIVRYLSLAQQR